MALENVHVFSKLLQLLGKPETDFEFQSLIQLIDEQPSTEYGLRYSFKKNGFCILSHRGVFSALVINVRSRDSRNPLLEDFAFSLPAGINTQDSLEEICRKLTSRPFFDQILYDKSSKRSRRWTKFHYLGFHLTFICDFESDEIESILVTPEANSDSSDARSEVFRKESPRAHRASRKRHQ